jgi:hypothetical protein
MFGNLLLREKFGEIGTSYQIISEGGSSSGNSCLNFGKRKACLTKKIALNSLQNDFLQAFFAHENRFFLSGGAALVGFYFGHRETHNLYLFTLENEIENGFRLVNETAKQLGTTVESIQTSPDFRRLLVKGETEAIVIDLVREYVFQISPEKPIINGIRVDPPEEILANKLCALLSRSEIRDLIDVRELENAGFSLENALQVAAKKDSGLTPAQLAWVLNQTKFGGDVQPSASVSMRELREYLADLINRLRGLAFPEN